MNSNEAAYGRLLVSGKTLLDDAQPQKALSEFEQARRQDPQRPEAYYYVARTLFMMGEAGSAEEVLDTIFRSSPQFFAEHPYALPVLIGEQSDPGYIRLYYTLLGKYFYHVQAYLTPCSILGEYTGSLSWHSEIIIKSIIDSSFEAFDKGLIPQPSGTHCYQDSISEGYTGQQLPRRVIVVAEKFIHNSERHVESEIPVHVYSTSLLSGY